MKRRFFLKGLLDGLLLIQGRRVFGAPAGDAQTVKQVVNGRQRLKLLLAGDVMTGRGIDQVLPHPGVATLHEAYIGDARDYVRLAERKNGPIPRKVDYRYIWGEALDVCNDSRPDLRIVNLETSVTTSGESWPSKDVHYRMHPENAPCLTAADIDCCVLANNHVLDWGRAGLEETLETLHDSGLATAGAGRNIEQATRPARLKTPGKADVLVFGFADTSGGVPAAWRADHELIGVNLLEDLSIRTATRVAEQIRAHRNHDDIVVVSIHWGGNWGYDVPLEQRQFAHHLVEHGRIDILHGHSSHHARAIEIYKGKPILYGCGDCLNDYEGIGGQEVYRPWLAPLYFVTVDGMSGAVESVEIVPMQVRRFQLVHALPEDRKWLAETINTVSKTFGTIIESRNGSLFVSPSPG